MQYHFMGYAARVEKLFLKLWSGADYCRVAQIHWVAGNKQEAKHNCGLSNELTAKTFLNKCDTVQSEISNIIYDHMKDVKGGENE